MTKEIIDHEHEGNLHYPFITAEINDTIGEGWLYTSSEFQGYKHISSSWINATCACLLKGCVSFGIHIYKPMTGVFLQKDTIIEQGDLFYENQVGWTTSINIGKKSDSFIYFRPIELTKPFEHSALKQMIPTMEASIYDNPQPTRYYTNDQITWSRCLLVKVENKHVYNLHKGSTAWEEIFCYTMWDIYGFVNRKMWKQISEAEASIMLAKNAEEIEQARLKKQSSMTIEEHIGKIVEKKLKELLRSKDPMIDWCEFLNDMCNQDEEEN